MACRPPKIHTPCSPVKSAPHHNLSPVNRSCIAYIKIGLNSTTNRSVENLLRHAFPDLTLETFDVTHDLFHSRLLAALFMTIFTLREYGSRHGTLFSAPWRNTYTAGYFRMVQRLVRNRLIPRRYAFTFQTQSLFDASLPDVPNFVYTDHTHLANLTYPDFDRHSLASSAWLACEREIYQNAKMTFTMSSNISQSLIHDYQCPPNKIACVYGGSNLPAMPPAPAAKDYTKQNILFVGIDWERKRGPDLLTAFEKVIRTHPKASLTIAGCSPQTRLANVKVLGPCGPEKIARLYEEATIFCLPTRREPFGIAFIEAMSYGLPVIGTNLGAQPDFILPDRNGLLVEPGDVASLAQALDRLLADVDRRRRFGQCGYDLASKTYTWNNTSTLIQKNIQQCLTANDVSHVVI